MEKSIADVVERLRQPEYTGENRCPPCTVVNVLLATVVSGGATAVVAVTGGSPFVSMSVGTVCLAVALGVIYLRGYFVPGTPWFTRTYLPGPVLRAFGKRPIPGSSSPAVDVGPGGVGPRNFDVESVLDAYDPDGALREAGVVRADDGSALSESFREEWLDEVATLRRDDATTLERHLGRDLLIDRDEPSISEGKSGMGLNRLERDPDAMRRIYDDNDRLADEWVSDAALIADVAAASALRSRIPEWADRDDSERTDLAYGLRAFLAACPDCDGAIDAERTTIEGCCGDEDPEFAIVECTECGLRIGEFRL